MGLQAVINNRLLTIFSARINCFVCSIFVEESNYFLGNAFHTVHNEERCSLVNESVRDAVTATKYYSVDRKVFTSKLLPEEKRRIVEPKLARAWKQEKMKQKKK